MAKEIYVETLRHREAWEYYYGLGDSRSLMQVASRFNVSVQAVVNWSKSFNWMDKVKERDARVKNRLDTKTEDKIVSRKAELLQITNVAIGRFTEAVSGKKRVKQPDGTFILEDVPEADRLQIKSVKDFKDLIDIWLKLSGEPTDNIAINIQNKEFIKSFINVIDTVLGDNEDLKLKLAEALINYGADTEGDGAGAKAEGRAEAETNPSSVDTKT